MVVGQKTINKISCKDKKRKYEVSGNAETRTRFLIKETHKSKKKNANKEKEPRHLILTRRNSLKIHNNLVWKFIQASMWAMHFLRQTSKQPILFTVTFRNSVPLNSYGTVLSYNKYKTLFIF